MGLSYNLKFKKINYLGRAVLEKDGEIVLSSDAFCLRGKGAGDKGETIKLVDLKDVFVREEVVILETVAKEKYYLSSFKNLMNDFVTDFMKFRNRFLIEALFLERGEMKREFDAHFVYLSRHGKTISKGAGKIQIYPKGVLVIPENREVFDVPFDFLANQDIDEINYEFSFTLDNGKKLIVNHLNTMFDDFQETLDKVREEMYQEIVNGFRNELPQFDATTILKIASLMRGGKAVPIKKIMKIDPELWTSFREVLLPSPESLETYEMLSSMTSEDYVYAGFKCLAGADNGGKEYVAWTLHALPEKNIVAIQITSMTQINTHFFQIIMEQGNPAEKVDERIQEIEQTLLTFNFDTQVFSKDRKELKKTKYRLALSKIPFLRSLRKSYLGRAYYKTKEDWQRYLSSLLEKASLKNRQSDGKRDRFKVLSDAKF